MPWALLLGTDRCLLLLLLLLMPDGHCQLHALCVDVCTTTTLADHGVAAILCGKQQQQHQMLNAGKLLAALRANRCARSTIADADSSDKLPDCQQSEQNSSTQTHS